MSFFDPAPKPKSLLGYHRVLAPTAGIKCSPLCLGAMNFGTGWKDFMGECDKDTSFAVLDAFFDLGGNFIDTANAYQCEESEEWLGEWMEKKKNRDQMVIATKYTTGYRGHARDAEPLQSNFVGNSFKSMHISVNRSLKKLRSDYIDLLYVHWWDFSTSVEEVMHGLNALITAGKVLYLGVSDTPAWVVVKANDYARAHGLRPFSVYQGKWNASYRDMEREIIPMCQDQGMALAPWGPLGQGKFKTKEARSKEHEGSARASQSNEQEIAVSEALEKVADKHNATMHGVALAYVMHKTPNVFPIVGQRKVEHLKANIDALSIRLTQEDIKEIEGAAPFDPGFPHTFLFADKWDVTNNTAADVKLTGLAARIDAPPTQKPVQPRTEV
ncbi:Aldo/keto reductase [Aureobasidium pullulans EXF-150]|uniref:Aldo/keto reductase n=1 Tax=Aureobasidium pullulans EXF-150 TaxID=1043002 RepID=A0A074XJX3_AURPU|nr:Aldo/keto reductase [Aureobasidium pullulans EXF-150]KEQ82337.1 Aldo/keto reductase [Aureobasidium pullulans EXF-150]